MKAHLTLLHLPGSFQRLDVWIWTCLQVFLSVQVSGNTDPIFQLGKLVFYQNEGNSTLTRDTGELAASVQTVAAFELLDPVHAQGRTKLTYTWDFGNGEVIEGTDPVVRYNYTTSGNYTLRLHVGGNWTQPEAPISHLYSMDLKVLDVIQHIEMEGPASYPVAENVSMLFHVDGSPPMWVCWQVIHGCSSVVPVGCTWAALYGRTLRVEHTFTSKGLHCLELSVHNDVSTLHASYSVHVGRGPYSNLFFTLSCVVVLVATFAFIALIACRPRRPNLLKVGPSSALFQTDEEGAGVSNVKLSFSGLETGESQPLILQPGPQYS